MCNIYIYEYVCDLQNTTNNWLKRRKKRKKKRIFLFFQTHGTCKINFKRTYINFQSDRNCLEEKYRRPKWRLILKRSRCGTRIDVGFSIACKTAIKSQGSRLVCGGEQVAARLNVHIGKPRFESNKRRIVHFERQMFFHGSAYRLRPHVRHT